MRVLVTGSSTPLGAALVRTLAGWGDEVVGLDPRGAATTEVVAALADRDAVARAVRDVDAIVDVAAFAERSGRRHGTAALDDADLEGTRVLLEAAAAARVQAYVRTSRFQCVVGVPGSRARWIDEDAAVLPGDAGAAARVALESYCELFARHHRMPCTLLQIAGLLDEPDGATVDAPARGGRRIDELLHRRVDLEDAVSAHVLALHAQRQASSRRYLIAATTPFSRDDIAALAVDAPAVVARRVPEYADVYRRRGWRISPAIDHVLDSARARRELGWQPRYDFRTAIARLARGEPPGSLTRLSGDARPGGRAPGGVAA